jgi:hypothetical protein
MKELKLYSKFIPHENVKERNEVKAFVAHKVTKELVTLFTTALTHELVDCIQEKITDKLEGCLVRDPPGVTNYNRESYDIYNTTVAIGFDFEAIADFIIEHSTYSVFSDLKDAGVIPEHLRREQERLWLLRCQK